MSQTAKFGILTNRKLIWEVAWTFQFQRYGRKSSEKTPVFYGPYTCIKVKNQRFLKVLSLSLCAKLF